MPVKFVRRVQAMQQVREWRDVDVRRFRDEIQPLGQPAVLSGLVADWPAVQQARMSPQAIASYLQGFDQGRPTALMVAPAESGGRFFYRPDMKGLNFERRKTTIAAALGDLIAQLDRRDAPAMFIESVPIPAMLPQLGLVNRLELLPDVAPRIWIGNAVVVQTHFDLASNIACVVAGRRRFTLFPPDQVRNLYVGPFDFTLSGPPVSMVSLREPDFARYPRFREALEVAQVAELAPGDALYMPYGWWHNVESLEAFNVLINYWWNDVPATSSPFDSLLHAVVALRDLPPEQRAVWRHLFEHYAFRSDDEDPLAHLSPEHRGMLGPLTPERVQMIKAVLAKSLSR